ncbi:MAG: response regulator transcription factor [Dehalococcoidales bacterium]|nr:response regulator transcription factor [Dehalococcoidales bacterium]
MGNKILVIDDDPSFLRLVEQILTQQGYEVLTASSGEEGLRILFAHKPDLVLLDVVMVKMDGWQTCQRIRDISDIPIIMITGKHKAEEDIVRGLDYGADDYLIKPVGNRELIARVRAVLRRTELPPSAEARTKITYIDDFLTIDVADRKVIVNGKQVKFTPREFSLLALLVQNAGHILTHKQVLEKVWGWEYTDDLDYVRIYISHLRQKIEPVPAQPRYIITEPGVGYKFEKAD